MDRVTTDVRACQRCGRDHLALAFAPLLNPADEWNYWALCPATSQPILMTRVERSVSLGMPSTGDPAKDAEFLRRFSMHGDMIENDVCPNSCGALIRDERGKHCPKCGFSYAKVTINGQ